MVTLRARQGVRRRSVLVSLATLLIAGAVSVTSAAPAGAGGGAGVYGAGAMLNGWGQIGNGNRYGDDVPLGPVTIPSPSPIVAIAAGAYESAAVLVDGTLWTWGGNTFGALGRDTSGSYDPNPGRVTAVSGIIDVAAGDSFMLALRADGAVVAWGYNTDGQVGNGTVGLGNSTPVQVSGLGPGSGIVAVAAGHYHSLALRADGAVFAWGNNRNGELGDGTTSDRTIPVPVTGLGSGSGVVAIAAGLSHSLAAKADGSVVAWGGNAAGQLGNGTTSSSPVPVAVQGFGAGSGVMQIEAGANDSSAVKADGSLWTWGDGSLGRRCKGPNPVPNLLWIQSTPEVVSGFGTGSGVVRVAMGWQSTVFLKADGTLYGCGYDQDGQLGVDSGGLNRDADGNIQGAMFFESPAQMRGFAPGSGAIAVDNGFAHTIVLVPEGGIGATTNSGESTTSTSGVTTTSTTMAAPGTMPEVAIGDVELQQGDSGTRNAVVTLTLDRPSPYPVIVNVRTTPDPENDGTYVPINRNIRFGEYRTVKTVVVRVYGSTTNDLDKRAILEVTPVVNASVEKGQGEVAIEPDTASSQVFASVSDVTVVEGDSGANRAYFTVSLNRPTTVPVEVYFATADYGATAADYTPKLGKVSFLPGGTISKQVAVAIKPDGATEADEHFVLQLTGSVGANLDQHIGVGTIEDNDV
jgi:alpha-tubulin suppressor-like RCC1 family protein